MPTTNGGTITSTATYSGDPKVSDVNATLFNNVGKEFETIKVSDHNNYKAEFNSSKKPLIKGIYYVKYSYKYSKDDTTYVDGQGFETKKVDLDENSFSAPTAHSINQVAKKDVINYNTKTGQIDVTASITAPEDNIVFGTVKVKEIGQST
jgi:glutaredoxin